MYLVSSRGQLVRDYLFDASGTITTGGTPQLILPERRSTTVLFIQNLSTGPLWVEFGNARATATITSGVVTSVSMVNKGFNYTIAPIVHFYGGGATTGWGANNGLFLGCGLPDYQSPAKVATGHAVMTGSAGNLSVNSITIDYGGANYAIAPAVFIDSSLNDPFGCADPSANSGTGIYLGASGGNQSWNGTACPTDAIAIYGATTGQQFTCKWMR